MTDVLQRLADYRLDRDLTFAALAAEMQKAGYPVPERALHRILTRKLATAPRERTVYKITQFVARRCSRKARRRTAA